MDNNLAIFEIRNLKLFMMTVSERPGVCPTQLKTSTTELPMAWFIKWQRNCIVLNHLTQEEIITSDLKMDTVIRKSTEDTQCMQINKDVKLVLKPYSNNKKCEFIALWDS